MRRRTARREPWVVSAASTANQSPAPSWLFTTRKRESTGEFFLIWIRRNPLKSPDSDEENQRNPNRIQGIPTRFQGIPRTSKQTHVHATKQSWVVWPCL